MNKFQKKIDYCIGFYKSTASKKPLILAASAVQR